MIDGDYDRKIEKRPVLIIHFISLVQAILTNSCMKYVESAAVFFCLSTLDTFIDAQ